MGGGGERKVVLREVFKPLYERPYTQTCGTYPGMETAGSETLATVNSADTYDGRGIPARGDGSQVLVLRHSHNKKADFVT